MQSMHWQEDERRIYNLIQNACRDGSKYMYYYYYLLVRANYSKPIHTISTMLGLNASVNLP